MSVMSVSTKIHPSRPNRTRAADGKLMWLRKAEATPMPTSQRPSRTCAGCALRFDQPNRAAPSFRQRTSWRSENRRSGFSGSPCVSLRTRNAPGSMRSFSAISSIAISSAFMPGASLGARIALPSGKSSTARRIAIIRVAPA